MTFEEFIQDHLNRGFDRVFGAGLGRLLGLPAGAPAKVGEYDSEECADNMDHHAELILDPAAASAKPIFMVFYAGREDRIQNNKESYLFRLTPQGVLDKAFVSLGKLHEDGTAVRGSGKAESKDINSIEIKERLKHELNFWLKGMYRLTPEEIAAKKAAAGGGQAALDEGKLQNVVESAVKRATEKPAEAAQPIRSDVDEPSYKKPENAENYAIVVGIEKYSDLPEAQFAGRDAKAMREHLLALGFPQRNIHMLLDQRATKTGLMKNVETWLPNNAGENSTVFFFYSGHGAPDTKSQQPFLVPFDGDPQYMEDTGYSLKRLYAKLGALKAKRIIIALDSCFSGAGGRSVLAKGAKPLVLKADTSLATGKAVVLSASQYDQISGTIEEQGHGAFTYFLLKGLNGEAAGTDGAVTVKSLYDYLAPKVADASRRENRDQTPQLLPTNAAAEIRLR